MSSETRSGKTVSADVQPSHHSGLFHRVVVSLGAVLAYAPFGWWIGAAYPSFAIAGGVLAIVMALAPDTLTECGIPAAWTHSLVGAVAIGGVCGAGGWWVANHIVVYAARILVMPGAAAEYGFVVGGLAAYGHIIADGLTGRDVRPLWPVSGHGGSVDLLGLVNPRNNEGNANLLGTIVLVAVVVGVLSTTVTATVLMG